MLTSSLTLVVATQLLHQHHHDIRHHRDNVLTAHWSLPSPSRSVGEEVIPPPQLCPIFPYSRHIFTPDTFLKTSNQSQIEDTQRSSNNSFFPHTKLIFSVTNIFHILTLRVHSAAAAISNVMVVCGGDSICDNAGIPPDHPL